MPGFVPLDVGYRPRVASARVWAFEELPKTLRVAFWLARFRADAYKHEPMKEVALGQKDSVCQLAPPLCAGRGFWLDSSLYLMGIEVVKMVSCRSRNLPFAS